MFTILEWDSSGTKLLVCDIRGCITIYTSKDYLISDWKPYFQQTFASETFLTAAWFHPGIVSTINVANQNLKNPANHLLYTEKIQQSKFGASLRLFGGKSAEGCILVSSTGLVCSLTLMTDGSVDVATESLGPLRGRIEVVDICHDKDGSFICGTSAGPLNATILFYQINLVSKNVTLDEVDSVVGLAGNKRITIICKQFYSFHLNIMAQMLNERENTTTFERVSHIKFVTSDFSDSVLVEASGQNLSLIELWELESKKKPPVHSAILDHVKSNSSSNNQDDVKPNITNTATRPSKEENGSTVSTLPPQSLSNDESKVTLEREWLFKGNYITDKDLITIHTPKFKLFGSNRQLDIILLAYRDSSIYCMRKEDLQPVQDPINLSSAMTRLPNNQSSCFDNDNSPHKMRNSSTLNGTMNHLSNLTSHMTTPANTNGLKSKTMGTDMGGRACFLTDMQLTCNQAAFIAIDSDSQLHAVKLPHLLTCQDIKDDEIYLQYLFEYCLVTGNDWWDALVCVETRESIERICDRFHDAYERQPEHVQKKYFNRQLMIRASLYRCLNIPTSVCKASDCHTTIMLNSIGSTLKSVLRSQDQESPAQSLAELLKTQSTQPNYLQCNNVISKLNEKDFHIETNLSQCLQPLSQWIVDLAIFLVVSIPQRLKLGHMLPGAGLANDKEALKTIRELLIIIKIWGVQNEASLPVVHTLTQQVDVIGTTFRLISMMYVSLLASSTTNTNGLSTMANEETLLNESTQLASNISVAQFEFSLSPIGFVSPLYRQSQQPTTPNQKQAQPSAGVVLEYFREPYLPKQTACQHLEEAINMTGSRVIDIVRNISLGAHPITNLRHCTRCKSGSLIKPSFNTSRAWEQRWITSCVCGGSWAQFGRNSASHQAELAQTYQFSPAPRR